jgi:hypothetical protein
MPASVPHGSVASLARSWFGRPRSARSRARGSIRLQLEQLENRLAPSNVTITVNTTSPTGSGGQIGLADAVATANGEASGTAVTINFDSTVFATPQTIQLTDGLELSNADVTIAIDATALASGLTIAGGGNLSNFSVFRIDPGVTAGLAGLTIRNGSRGGVTGGGIDNSGTLTVTGCTLRNNFAYTGGGIENDGTLTVTKSTLSGNSATHGGGIYNNDGSTLTVANSTLSGNSADDEGGGIFNFATLTITNSTLSGNSANDAGGIFNFNNASLTITSSTLSGNSANSHNGGGIYTYSASATLINTIVANSTGTDLFLQPSTPATFTGRNDLLDDTSGGTAGTGFASNGFFVNTYYHSAASLDGRGLADNGGPTQTIALLPGSLAIRTGSAASGGTDQRGIARPSTGQNDIGAFQSRGFILTVSAEGSPQSSPQGHAFPNPLAVTLTANDPGVPVDGTVITYSVQPAGGGAAATLSSTNALLSGGTASVTATANHVAGSYTVIASTPGIGNMVTFDLSNQMDVLVITGTPATVLPGAAFTLTVTAQDVPGHTDANFSGSVTLSLASGPGALVGTLIGTAQSGVVTFTGLTLDTIGACTIQASATGLVLGTSSSVLVMSSRISGMVFFDSNGNGTLEPGEPGVAGRLVFLDLRHSGQLDPGDPSTVTGPDGSFQFTRLPAGTYTVREAIDYNNLALTGSPPGAIVLTLGNDVAGINLGNVIYNPAFPASPQADLFGPSATHDPNVAYIQGLYRSVLNRDADAAGLAYWLNGLNSQMTPTQVAVGFVNSSEHRRHQVDFFYQSLLNRAADGSSAYWVNLLLKDGNEAEVFEGIMTSPEYTSEHGSDTDFVNNLYTRLLGRQADSSGLAFWLQALARDTARAAAVERFLGSPESADLATKSFYAAFLHRKGEPGEVTFWDGQLTNRTLNFTQVALAFLSAPEFLSNAARRATG